jgi:hypothetical protein
VHECAILFGLVKVSIKIPSNKYCSEFDYHMEGSENPPFENIVNFAYLLA